MGEKFDFKRIAKQIDKYSNDLKGVAACGGIKNIYAMIVGTSMGINVKNEKDNKQMIFYFING